MDFVVKWIWQMLVGLLKAINSILLAGDQAILTAIGRPPEIPPEAKTSFFGFWDRTRDPIAKFVIITVRLFSIALFVFFATLAGKSIYQAFHIGSASELTNPKHQSEIPTTEATPGESFHKVYVQENWLTISQAENLKTHPGLNLVEINQDGTVRYSTSQSANFTSQSPWFQAGNPADIEGLNLEGTSVALTVYGQPVRIYVDQPFFLAGDTNNDVLTIYVVDPHGQLWMANASNVLTSLSNVHPHIKLNPDPLLTPGS